MDKFKYIYGPVPSRRMGLSLGVSPIIDKKCNYSCVYCQLGRTSNMVYKRKEFIPLEDIIFELKEHLKKNVKIDVVTIVGEGEPTLYSRLGELIVKIKKLTDKPVAVITNGSLLYDESVKKELKNADIVLPSLDAYSKEVYKKIDRPHGNIIFEKVINGLIDFSKEFNGELWIEIMLIKGINDSKESILKFKEILKEINYQRLFINTPVRPPAEKWVEKSENSSIKRACEILNGTSIETILSTGFDSNIHDDYEAILSIIKRHPMNQYELKTFLEKRKSHKIYETIEKLDKDNSVSRVKYMGYITYRIKNY